MKTPEMHHTGSGDNVGGDKFERQVNQGDHATYNHHVHTTYSYGPKTIKKLLGSLPPFPQTFLGRDEQMADFTQQVERSHGTAIQLINAQGGIGKTAFAARYFQIHLSRYEHLIWLYAEDGIGNALLSLAVPLSLQFEDNASAPEKLRILFDELRNLHPKSLLVLDNANELKDLDGYAMALGQLPNMDVIVTSRCPEVEGMALVPLPPLKQEPCRELFTTHFPAHKPEDDGLLNELLEAIGYNTLVVELMAKNLQQWQRQLKQGYDLRQLVADLREKGFLGVPGKEIATGYQARGFGFRKERPEDILAGMYDLGSLTEAERGLMSLFSVLPAEQIPYHWLDRLIPSEELDRGLIHLADQGWLDRQQDLPSFRISPVVQEIVLHKHGNRLFADCKLFIDALNEKLKYEPGSGHPIHVSYAEAADLVRWGAAMVPRFPEPEAKVGILCERIGSFYMATGDLGRALEAYLNSLDIDKELHEAFPSNVDFKNGLAISYQHLGRIHTALGDLDRALEAYQENHRLEMELHENFPGNVDFKNGLAISYQNLGRTHTALGDLDRALEAYQEAHRLEQELHEAFPGNVEFKNGLAITYQYLGYTHTALGDLDRALEAYLELHRLEGELHEAFPGNVDFKNGLAISHQFLGNTHTALGDLDRALETYQEYHRLERDLHEAFPGNVDLKNNLAISYQYLGNTHTSLGDLDRALEAYQEYHRLEMELHEAFPRNVDFKNNLADSHAKLGQYYQSEHPSIAIPHFQAAKKLWEELVAAAPGFVEYRKNLDAVRRDLAEMGA